MIIASNECTIRSSLVLLTNSKTRTAACWERVCNQVSANFASTYQNLILLITGIAKIVVPGELASQNRVHYSPRDPGNRVSHENGAFWVRANKNADCVRTYELRIKPIQTLDCSARNTDVARCCAALVFMKKNRYLKSIKDINKKFYMYINYIRKPVFYL